MPDSVRVGVDIGGTFTDIVTIQDGNLHTEKTPTTPDTPETAVTTGIETTTAAIGVDPAAISFLAHGTTVATNAVLEGEWADTALLTTAGFRDVLEIGRQARPDIYDLDATKPETVVPRRHRYDVPERLDERGNELEELDEDTVETIAAACGDRESIAVCFVFAYENPDHEQRTAEILAEELEVPVSISSDVLPEIREYERTLTTTLNAALRPVVATYLSGLRDDLQDRGLEADLTIMGSNGGVMAAETAETQPVKTLLSGPAAGVMGATHVAGNAGITELVTMDMGGTSCDVSLVTAGEPTVSTDVSVGAYPVGVPMVDIHTVGAGGGSVAWIDDGGALRVGPRSAGADPGPVCYGRGGKRPTTTDAQVVLGRIDPGRILESPAELADVESVVRDRLADPLNGTVAAAASGVVSVANANMERALRVVSVERGYDPRELTLVAYGGAGPLHAPELARALEMRQVLVPPSAGVLSALGLLVSDVTADVSTSMVRPWDAVDAESLEAVFADLRTEAAETLATADIPEADRGYERGLELRYAGQSFDLGVSVPASLTSETLAGVRDRFDDRHETRYGHAAPDEPVELVTVRLRARGHIDTPPTTPDLPENSVEDAIRETRAVHFDDTIPDTPVYTRRQLPLECHIEGPAVIEGEQSTALVHPDQVGTIDDHGNLLIDIDP